MAAAFRARVAEVLHASCEIIFVIDIVNVGIIAEQIILLTSGPNPAFDTP
jgi:hypothetical protein